jgi:hypothetical protein
MRLFGHVMRVSTLLAGVSIPAFGCGSGPHPGTKMLPFQAPQIVAAQLHSHSAAAPQLLVLCGFSGAIFVLFFSFLQRMEKSN